MAYEAQARDTSVEIDRMLFDAYRAMTPAEKVRRMGELTSAVTVLALAGIRARHPGCSEREARLRLATLRYGPDLIDRTWTPGHGGSGSPISSRERSRQRAPYNR